MPANRTTVTGGIWALGAADAPPAPIEGVTYKDSGLLLAEITAAWPFKEIVGSDKFNEMMFRLTTLMTQLESWGVLPWSTNTEYGVGALVLGSDAALYRSKETANEGNDPLVVPAKWDNIFSIYALLASPAFTGNPTAPTQAPGNDSTRLSTTAFVAAAVALALDPFKSAAFTMAANQIFTYAHGLGAVPVKTWLAARCKTAELGYAIDDWANDIALFDLVNHGPVNIRSNVTNVYFASGDSQIRAINQVAAATANWTQMTPANWDLHIFASLN